MIVTTNSKEGDPNLCLPIMIKNPEISSNYLNLQAVNCTKKMKSTVYRPSINPNLVCWNRYKSFVADEESDFRNEFVKYIYQDTDLREDKRCSK